MCSFKVFTLGVLTGVLSIWIRAAGQKHFDICVETVVAYVPSAAAIAAGALEGRGLSGPLFWPLSKLRCTLNHH
jgi:hypothetical protein